MHVSNLKDVPGRFDLIVMIHVIEHMPNPVNSLRDLGDKLADRGVIVLEVPEYGQNPFDLLVADHCTHFSQETLSRLAMAGGYSVLSAATDWIPKEVSVVAEKPTRVAASQDPLVGTAALDLVRGKLQWLAVVRDYAHDLAKRGVLGLFGTSIAATWLVAELGSSVSFLVDEDPRRTGREFMGLPVYTPAQAPGGSDVLIALPNEVAEKIHKRIGTRGLVALPPAATFELRERPARVRVASVRHEASVEHSIVRSTDRERREP